MVKWAKMIQEGDDRQLTTDDRQLNKKKWLESLVSGALSLRRMVRREDVPKVFFLYLCLFHVSPAHPCGRNPISRFQPLTKMLGRDINSLLNLLRTSNPPLYQQVQDEWRRYADCVGLVDTGYFKRSLPATLLAGQEPARGNPMGLQTTLASRRAQRLLSLMRSLVQTSSGGEASEEPTVRIQV